MVEDMEEEFIPVPEGEEIPAAGASRVRRLWFVLLAAALAVFLLAGGAFAFGKHGGPSSFLANVSSLFREAFTDGGTVSEFIPLRGGDGVVASPPVPSRTASTPAAAAVTTCVAPPAAAPSRAVLINEVAWAGAAGRPAAEWVELLNPGSAAISLDGWQLTNKSGGIRVVFGARDAMGGGGFYLLERRDDGAVPGVAADAFFTNAIRNSDETLTLFDAGCGVVDAVAAAKTWPAGEGYPAYRSMERGADLSWHTYSGNGTGGIFGTPRAGNSVPVALDVLQGKTSPSTAPAAPEAPPDDTLLSPAGIVLISEVMAGVDGNSDYEFVELYNPGNVPISLTGWRVKKRASTGNVSSLVAASRLEGKAIPAGGYFLLADEEGYAGPVRADAVWAKSYSLAYTANAVLLMGAAGEQVDEAAWAKIPKGGSYARVPVTSATFSVQATPTPRNSGL